MIITKDYEMKPRYMETFSRLKGKVLDIGCYKGKLDIKAILNGFDVTGIDISPNFLKEATQNAIDSGIEFKCFLESVEDLPNDIKYDTIIMMEVIEHISDPLQAIKNALEILNEGGQLLITTPNGFAHYSPDHINFFFEMKDVELLERLWTFDMLAHTFRKTATFIDINGLLKNIEYPYELHVKEWKDSVHPSLDFYIIIKKVKE